MSPTDSINSLFVRVIVPLFICPNISFVFNVIFEETVLMELPRNAPRRKIDLYLYQLDQVRPTLGQIQRSVEQTIPSPKKRVEETATSPNKPDHPAGRSREEEDVISVLHGIGPDGCTAVASLILQLKQAPFSHLISTSEPLIELWEGLPTFHSFVSRNKSKDTF